MNSLAGKRCRSPEFQPQQESQQGVKKKPKLNRLSALSVVAGQSQILEVREEADGMDGIVPFHNFKIVDRNCVQFEMDIPALASKKETAGEVGVKQCFIFKFSCPQSANTSQDATVSLAFYLRKGYECEKTVEPFPEKGFIEILKTRCFEFDNGAFSSSKTSDSGASLDFSMCKLHLLSAETDEDKISCYVRFSTLHDEGTKWRKELDVDQSVMNRRLIERIYKYAAVNQEGRPHKEHKELVDLCEGFEQVYEYKERPIQKSLASGIDNLWGNPQKKIEGEKVVVAQKLKV